MSHVVTITTEIREPAALRAACLRLGLTPPVRETVQLFSSKATGYCVRLPAWRYPVVCDVDNGAVKYDNFGERWGAQRELDRLMQSYAIEAARSAARREGHSVSEQPLVDGSVKLTIHVGESN